MTFRRVKRRSKSIIESPVMDKTTLIYKVLAGTAADTEKRELDEWIGRSEANRAEYEDIRLLWENTKGTGKDGDDIHFYDGLDQIRNLMQQRRKRKRRKKVIVSVVLLVFGAVMFGYLILLPPVLHPFAYQKFENTTLDSVIHTLEQQYRIDIEVDDRKVLACRFTGAFYNQSVEDIVRVIASNLNLTYEVGGEGRYLLTGQGCQSPNTQ